MSDKAHGTNSVVKFFMLTFLFTIPLYVMGPEPLGFIVWVILTQVAPIAAALILSYLDAESSAMGLLKRYAASVKIPNIIWYIPIIFLMPSIWVLGNLLLSLFADAPGTVFTLAQLPIILFNIVLSSGEEIGWMGYAYNFMEEKWQAFKAAIILGVLWAIWHVPLFYLTGSSLMWVFGFGLNLVAWRVLIVWVYKNTGNSLFAVSVFHATGTYATTMLPYMSEPSGGVLGVGVATVVTIITALIVVTLGKLNQ